MEYKIRLSAEHLAYICQCLENGVYRLSAPVLEGIRQQIVTQQAPATQEVDPQS